MASVLLVVVVGFLTVCSTFSADFKPDCSTAADGKTDLDFSSSPSALSSSESESESVSSFLPSLRRRFMRSLAFCLEMNKCKNINEQDKTNKRTENGSQQI